MNTTPDSPWVLFAAGLRNLADQSAKSFDARTVDNGPGTVYDVDPGGPAERLAEPDVHAPQRMFLEIRDAILEANRAPWEHPHLIPAERYAEAALSVVQPLLTSDEIQLRSLTESQDRIRAAAGLPEDIEVGDLIAGVRSLRAELTEARRDLRETQTSEVDGGGRPLKVCRVHPGHAPFNAFYRCPWCEVNKLRVDRDRLSGLLRGMARKVAEWRQAAGAEADFVDEQGIELTEARAELTEARRLADGYLGQSKRALAELAEAKQRPTVWAYQAACDALEKRRTELVKVCGLPSETAFYDAVRWVAALREQAVTLPEDWLDHGKPIAPRWVESVLPGQIVHERNDRWPNFHPEDFCHRCGHRNVAWTAPPVDWQAATTGSPRGEKEILCPSCFAILLEANTGASPIWQMSRWIPPAPEPSPVDRKYGLGQHAPIGNPEPEKAAQPRVFPLDSPKPDPSVTRVRGDNGVVFRRMAPAGSWASPWFATRDSGGDGSLYSWNEINSTRSSYGGMVVTEVLAPSTPDTPDGAE